MTEETLSVPAPAEKMEESAAPSTSAEQVEGEDVDNEAKKLMGAGRRHMVMKDVRAAVNSFQEACSILGKKYGETADECADAFYCYGMALLELARMENGVLGNALEGMPEDEEEDGEKEEDPNIPSASNLDEQGAESEDGEENGDENEGTEEKEDEEEVGNLQLAWEMLDLSKVIFKRQENKEAQLKAAQAHLKLGEVSVESENYGQAVEDFLACLAIQKGHLEEHDRLLAETHYQLGLAYQYSSKHSCAISHFTQSIEVIEKRMAVLTEQVEKASKESTEEVQKEMDELKGLLPEIREKIEDSKEAQKTAEATEKALKETLIGGTSGFSQENGSTSSAPVEKTADSTVQATNCVSDISHLVRKKRKPEEESPVKEAKKSKSELVESPVKEAKKSKTEPVESPVKEAKKSKTEPVESPVKEAKKSEPVENGSGHGDAVVPTNDVEKTEEEPIPMETTAVESTA